MSTRSRIMSLGLALGAVLTLTTGALASTTHESGNDDVHGRCVTDAFAGGDPIITARASQSASAHMEMYEGLWLAEYDAVDDAWDQASLTAGRFPDWAPDSRRILFKADRDLHTMDPYDTDSIARVITCPSNTNKWEYALTGPCWSPSATHFIYSMESKYVFKGQYRYTYDIHRAAADGSGKANLTEDLPNAGIAGWR